MRRFLAIMCVVGTLVLAMACGGTTYYQVVTLDGQKYTTAGQPKLDESAKTYTFQDLAGHKVILNQDQVKTIESVSK